MWHRAARCLLAACCGLMAPACHGLRGRNPDEAKILPKDSEANILPFSTPPGEPSFSASCKPFVGKRILLVTVNFEYYEMLQNWYYYARPYLTSHDQLVVFVEDTKLEQELMRDGSWVFVDTQGDLHLESGSKKKLMKPRAPYNTKDYNNLVIQRPARIGAFLEEGCTVLYSDVDMAWKSNPFREIAAAGVHDLFVANDQCQNQVWTKGRLNICTGFLYLQPTWAIKRLMERWSEKVASEKPNQRPFNNVLEEDTRGAGTVDFKFLPFEKFPPGCRAEDFQNDAANLHANWRVGLVKKVAFLKKYGFWHMN